MASPKRVFISATSADLRSYRIKVAELLRAQGMEPVHQDTWPPTFQGLRDLLAEKIGRCDAVICLIGNVFGAEPSDRPPHTLRRSYTQFEYDFAREKDKPVYVFLANKQTKFDYNRWFPWRQVREGDVERALQTQYREDIRKEKFLYLHFQDHASLLDQVRRIDWTAIRSGSGISVAAVGANQPRRLPYPSLRNLFKGRTHALEKLKRHLMAQAAHPETLGTVVRQTIRGLGGIGKTRLAVEYAWRNFQEYSALLFVEASSPETLRRELAALAPLLRPDVEGIATAEVEQQAAVTRHWLGTNPGWLLILDNADTEDAVGAVKELLGQLSSAGGQVLITSRMTHWFRGVDEMELETLSPEDAREYLLEATEQTRVKTNRDPEEALTLAGELEGLALALQQAADYIEYQRISLAEYRARWAAGQQEVLEYYQGTHEDHFSRSVATTWQTTLDVLGPGPRAALRLIAWLAPAPLPRALFHGPQAEEIFAECLAAAAMDGNDAGSGSPSLSRALADLAAYSMIQFDPETGARFTVHRLVQTITRRRIPDAERKRWVETALRLVDAYVPAEPPPNDVRSWGLWELLQAHVEAIVGYADAEGLTDPTTRLMNEVANYLQTRGLFELPEHFYRRALEIDEARLGPSHFKIALRLNNLALLLQDTNRLAESEPLMRRALEIAEASFGPAHPNVAIHLNNLAQLIQDTNRLAEAEPLMRRALEIDQASFGPTHPNVAIHLNNLARLLQDTKRLAEAEPLMRRALDIVRDSFGEDHPRTRTVVENYQVLREELEGADKES